MFALDAKLGGEKCNHKDKKKTKTEIKKELKDSIFNGRENENADMQDLFKTFNK